MKGGYLQIILILAIFLLPEIIKVFKKRNTKKYEYPDEQRYEMPSGSEDANAQSPQEAPQTPLDLWDILTGRANYQQSEQDEPVAVAEAADTAKPKASEKSIAAVLQPTRHSRVKISAKGAARGLIMAEILGKPRALRPIEKGLPCRREYR